jgi:uroporphyrinogen-III synthase/uroporphyrinogen III methyltransferase/synthase
LRLAAVGPGTAAALVDAFGLAPDVVAAMHDAADLAVTLPIRPGERVLTPGSSLARAELAAGLRARGAEVDAVVAYQTVIGSGGADVASLIETGEIDAIAFASPSAVDGFLTRLGATGSPGRRALGLPVGCIGATTADHAAARGFHLISIADRPTVDGLVDSLATALASSRKGAAA